MAAQNEKEFRINIISREEQTGTMLVSGDLQGYGGSIRLRIDRESWARIAEAVANFARLAPVALFIALLALVVMMAAQAAFAQTATPTATPNPMPTPYPAGALGPHGFLLTDTSTQMGNCQLFTRVASGTLYRASGISGAAQMIEFYDQATYAPSSGEIWPSVEVAANSSWSVDFSPGLTIISGLLICNSTNADPTQYTPGNLDTTFGIAFTPGG